jgi:hypothetical protein
MNQRRTPSLAFGDSSPASGGASWRSGSSTACGGGGSARERRDGGGLRTPALVAAAALALGACATGPTRDEGLATLDALKDAQAACAAKGGEMQLKRDGDPTSIDAYACVRK